MSLALGFGWALLVATAVLRFRPVPVPRVDALVAGRARRDVRAGVRATAAVLPRRGLLAGGLVLVAVALLSPPVAIVCLAVVAVRPHVAKRQASTRRQRAVERDVGDVVTLIGLAVNAGHNLLGALRAASAHADGPVGAALRSATTNVDHGVRLADALEALPADLGEVVRPIVVALVSCDRYGAPLGPTLDRLATDVRIASRQRAEAAARRLPIRLLFPLVTCILPAFGLLTVAPLIAGSLRGLRL